MNLKLKIVIFGLALVIPRLVFAYDFPGKPTGFINDYAGVLSDQEKNALETILYNFSDKTGNQISVATINTLNGDTIENFSEKLFKDWGVGQRNKDNGALLLVAIKERELRIEVGYGLEAYLTDADSHLIIQNLIIPSFKNGSYFLGIKNGILGMISKISNGFETEGIVTESTDFSKYSFFKNIDPFFFIFLIIFVVNLLANILGRSKSWWLGGILGGGFGAVLGIIFGFLYVGILSIIGLSLAGLIFDYFVSKRYRAYKEMGATIPWWMRGRGFGGGKFGGGGGFGGFGGGRSGGGGSSGKW